MGRVGGGSAVWRVFPCIYIYIMYINKCYGGDWLRSCPPLIFKLNHHFENMHWKRETYPCMSSVKG